MKFKLADHAESEVARRKIPRRFIRELLDAPQQIVAGHGGRVVYQSQFDFGSNKMYLLRAIIDHQVIPPTVVTIYRTSRIRKYWRE